MLEALEEAKVARRRVGTILQGFIVLEDAFDSCCLMPYAVADLLFMNLSRLLMYSGSRQSTFLMCVAADPECAKT